MAAYRAEIRQLLRHSKSIRRTAKGEWRLTIRQGRDAVLVISGPGASSALRAASALISRNKLAALVSVGFAGGLSEHSTAGSLVIADRVVELGSGASYACASDLLQDIEGQRGAIVTVPAVVATRAEKSGLASRWGVIAADMEAAAVAEVAAKAGLRFAAVKAITDGVNDELAIDFRRCLTENEGLSSVKIVFEGLKGLAQFRSLLLLARNSRLAANSLAQALAKQKSRL